MRSPGSTTARGQAAPVGGTRSQRQPSPHDDARALASLQRAAAAPGRATPTDDALAVQRLAGNAAAATIMRDPSTHTAKAKKAKAKPKQKPKAARKKPAARPAHRDDELMDPGAAAPVEQSPTDVLDGMTLAAFAAHARRHPDWAADATITKADRTQLHHVLAWYESDPSLAVAAKGMNVGAVRGTGLTHAVQTRLAHYAAAVAETHETVELDRIDNVATAVARGRVLQRIEPELAGKDLKKAMRSRHVDRLVTHGTQDLLDYLEASHPYFEASDGSDFDDYFTLRYAENVDPVATQAQLPHIRNFHRFEADALAGLEKNLKKAPGRFPAALILQAAHDHNGAFHRSAGMRALINRSNYLTVLVEGEATLQDFGDDTAELARRYGQGGVFREILVAGHGSNESMAFANNPDAPDHGRKREISLKSNHFRTAAFFHRLLDNMEHSPRARLVLDACLTASGRFDEKLSSDPATARKQVLDAVRKHPSLQGFVAKEAARRGIDPTAVLGGSGSYGGATLVDKADGNRMTLASRRDPELANRDKYEYVRHGMNPTGVMRATIECWARDEVRTRAAMQARIQELSGAGSVSEVAIQALFQISFVSSSLATMQRLADDAGRVEELGFDSECLVGGGASVRRLCWLSADVAPRLFAPLLLRATADLAEHAPLVITQAWAWLDGRHRSDFLQQVSRYPCRELADYVDLAQLAGHADLDSLLAEPNYGSGRVRLAVLALLRGSASDAASARRFFVRWAGPDGLPPGPDVAAAIDGFTSEDALRRAIGH